MRGRVSAIDELPAEPGPLAGRLRITSSSLDALLAGVVIFGAVLWRTWAVLKWTFQGDDWTFIADAARTSFGRFVTMPYHGHLQPGQFAIAWLVTRIAPLNYTIAVFPVLVLTIVAGVLMWKFLGALFGERPANLVPLAFLMLCPLTLPAALWWTASLITIPMQLFIVATLYSVLLYVRAPSIRRLVVVGLAYGGGVLFSEKGLLILPLVALFVLLYLGHGGGRERLRAVTLGLWRLWAVLGGITLAYVAWYVSVVTGQFTQHPSASQIGRLTITTLGSTVVPTSLGGPWSVSPFGKAVLYELPGPARIVTWTIAAAVVCVSLLLRRQAWRAWILPSVYLAMIVALVAFGRLGLFSAGVIGLGARYYADAVPVLAIGFALAFMVPLDRRRDPGWTRPAFALKLPGQRRAAAYDVSQESHGRRRAWTPWMSRGVVLALVVAYAISSLVTSYRMAGLAARYTGPDWLSTVRSQLEMHPTASVVDGALPVGVAPLSLPADKLSRTLAPIAPSIRWNAPSENMFIFDPFGRLRPVVVVLGIRAKPGPSPPCGYSLNGRPLTVPLQGHLFSWIWGIRVAYFAGSSIEGFVTVDGDRQAVRFLRGLHPLFLVHHGTATAVTFESAAGHVCVGDVRVGKLTASTSG
jgi:Dolichyl-phosphate-mannose-protein mannosyltransferase